MPKVKGGMAMPRTEDDWRCEEDLRAYSRAQTIQKDPDRMKKMQSLAKQKVQEFQDRKEEAQVVIDLASQADKK